MEDTNSKKSFFKKLKQGLSRTRKGFVKNIDEMIFGEKVISRDLFNDLEEILIMADMGPAFTYDLIEEMKANGDPLLYWAQSTIL